MRGQTHVITKGIGTEISTQGDDHVVFSHELDWGNGEFFDVLGGGEDYAHNLFL